MKRSMATVFALCTVLAAPETASAKGRTVKIEINGATLELPLEITDPAIVDKFNIWNGPGVQVNGQPVHLDPNDQTGMFIDWPKGSATNKPRGLQHYEITFHLYVGQGRRAPSDRWTRYIVFYEYAPETGGGYILLPGPNDGQQGMNPAIAHGVEGQWLYSTKTWDKLVRPLIDEATCDSQATNANAKRQRRLFGSFI